MACDQDFQALSDAEGDQASKKRGQGVPSQAHGAPKRRLPKVLISYILIALAHLLGLFGYIGLVLAHQPGAHDPPPEPPPDAAIQAAPAPRIPDAPAPRLYLIRIIVIEAPHGTMTIRAASAERGRAHRLTVQARLQPVEVSLTDPAAGPFTADG